MEGSIELRGLIKTYRGSGQEPVHAVRGIDISIAPGETVALLGPNGAGKSTTIDMMLGLTQPDGGEVTLFGRSPRAAVDAGEVGAMLQTGDLLRDLSVRELVALVASLYPRAMDVDEVLAVAGLSAVASQRTQKLSGGQTQRVRFAVALVPDPRLLVLDEPTVAMDAQGRRDFWAAMREYAAEGRTVLFATHYLEEADANADRAVLMAAGRVVADGPTTEIKSRVGTRTIRATLPDAAGDALSTAARRQQRRTPRRSRDSALRRLRPRDPRLLERYPAARDIEITGAGLEEAFLELTAEGATDELARAR